MSNSLTGRAGANAGNDPASRATPATSRGDAPSSRRIRCRRCRRPVSARKGASCKVLTMTLPARSCSRRSAGRPSTIRRASKRHCSTERRADAPGNTSGQLGQTDCQCRPAHLRVQASERLHIENSHKVHDRIVCRARRPSGLVGDPRMDRPCTAIGHLQPHPRLKPISCQPQGERAPWRPNR
jgi:hypothetical protein